MVKAEVEKLTSKKINMIIKNIEDFRNYKVSVDKAKTELGFQPQYSVRDTVLQLFENRNYYGDYERDEFYNIRTFKKIDQK
jgi:nucleoside-diphosphate-sugar epimerase